MSPVGISLLMLLGMAGFVWLCWRKLAIVVALQPLVRWDRPVERLRSVLVNGFMQQRMVQREWRPGLMHAVIFLGFMSLLIRKVQLLAIGYRMLQLLALPLETLGTAALRDALQAIARS